MELNEAVIAQHPYRGDRLHLEMADSRRKLSAPRYSSSAARRRSSYRLWKRFTMNSLSPIGPGR